MRGPGLSRAPALSLLYQAERWSGWRGRGYLMVTANQWSGPALVSWLSPGQISYDRPRLTLSCSLCTPYPQRTGAMHPNSSPIHRCPLECLSAGAVVLVPPKLKSPPPWPLWTGAMSPIYLTP